MSRSEPESEQDCKRKFQTIIMFKILKFALPLKRVR